MMKFIQRWKEEWWNRHESEIVRDYAERESELKQELDSHLEADRASFEKTRKLAQEAMDLQVATLKVREKELEELTKLMDSKRLDLARKNEELLNQIKLIEAKTSPSNVWVEAFGMGFSKAWDMMAPILMEGVKLSKKSIEDMAITDTLKRMNGNNKKTH